MNKLEGTIQTLYDKNILVKNTRTKSVVASTIKVDNNYAIFFDKKKIVSDKELYVILKHEEAHIETGALYGFDTSMQTIKRREYRANKYMITNLLPVEELKKALNSGLEVWEISDRYGVTEDLIVNAFELYKRKEMI